MSVTKETQMKAIKNQKGQSAIEYALVAIVLLAIVVAAIAQPMRDTISAVHGKAKADSAALPAIVTT